MESSACVDLVLLFVLFGLSCKRRRPRLDLLLDQSLVDVGHRLSWTSTFSTTLAPLLWHRPARPSLRYISALREEALGEAPLKGSRSAGQARDSNRRKTLSATDIAASLIMQLKPEEWQALRALEKCTLGKATTSAESIAKVSGQPLDRVNFGLNELNKRKLIGSGRTYEIYIPAVDLLALKFYADKDYAHALGKLIAKGKESDVYEVLSGKGDLYALKLFRLGRTSFRDVTRKRHASSKPAQHLARRQLPGGPQGVQRAREARGGHEERPGRGGHEQAHGAPQGAPRREAHEPPGAGRREEGA